jgi:prepilin-type N-terminal cleavage/methylation domain-containing protein
MTTKNKKGFTIIEVVLVLAIAGLIFLMVFIALPALQRSQRNTQREDDLARILTAVNQYQANNNGKVPFGTATAGSELAKFVSRYVDKECKVADFSGGTFSQGCSNEFKDPQGEIYHIEDKGSKKTATFTNNVLDVSSEITSEKTFYGYAYATCGDEGTIVKGTGDRDVAIFMKLEGGAIACNDNH